MEVAVQHILIARLNASKCVTTYTICILKNEASPTKLLNHFALLREWVHAVAATYAEPCIEDYVPVNTSLTDVLIAEQLVLPGQSYRLCPIRMPVLLAGAIIVHQSPLTILGSTSFHNNSAGQDGGE